MRDTGLTDNFRQITVPCHKHKCNHENKPSYWKSMISKYEERNNELEIRESELRERLKMMETMTPAIMLYNMWKMMYNYPCSENKDNFVKKFPDILREASDFSKTDYKSTRQTKKTQSKLVTSCSTSYDNISIAKHNEPEKYQSYLTDINPMKKIIRTSNTEIKYSRQNSHPSSKQKCRSKHSLKPLCNNCADKERRENRHRSTSPESFIKIIDQVKRRRSQEKRFKDAQPARCVQNTPDSERRTRSREKGTCVRCEWANAYTCKWEDAKHGIKPSIAVLKKPLIKSAETELKPLSFRPDDRKNQVKLMNNSRSNNSLTYTWVNGEKNRQIRIGDRKPLNRTCKSQETEINNKIKSLESAKDILLTERHKLETDLKDVNEQLRVLKSLVEDFNHVDSISSNSYGSEM